MFRHSLGKYVLLLSIATATLGKRNNAVYTSYHSLAEPAIYPRNYAEQPSLGPMLPRQEQTVNGLTAIDTFSYNGESWTSYEDLTRFDGPMVLLSESGIRRELARRVEATTVEALDLNRTVERFFGLDPANDVNLKQNDVLAELLLKDGEPIEENVRDVIDMSFGPFDTILGNVQSNDTMRIGIDGDSKNYQPLNDVPGALDGTHGNKTWDGLLGGWMPSSRKIFRGTDDAGDWIEAIVFADVDAQDPKIVHLWFSTKWVKGGVVREKNFGLDYPEFLPIRKRPTANEFYPALLRYADYWESKLRDISPLTLPEQTWTDMAKHAFAVELVQRGGGVASRYGAFERDYGGSEYEGFQDIFTTSLTANLAWGRFEQARAIFENYMDWYVFDNGDINMRGPEVPQFGMSLSLVARYVQYTGDLAFVEKYRGKILAWAKLLTDLHDESLKLPVGDPYYGLISGWSESDAALEFDAWRWSKPYWNNGAFAVRGLKDLSKIETFAEYAEDWTSRAGQNINQTSKTLDRFIQQNSMPPYVPVLANETLHVIEDLTENGRTSPQRWAHRVYAELLHASILSENQTDLVINSMQAYGLTSLGGVANVTPLKPDTRDILGFVSYGYALSLLLQDRIDEFILFLYTHRYHVHSRGQWIAAEVSGTGGGASAYCQPSQFGLPIVLRAALLFEHPDEEVLFVMRGIPRKWLSNGKVGIQKAPTRWGLVSFETRMDVNAGTVTTELDFEKLPPGVVRVKFRLPEGRQLKSATVNGQTMDCKGEEVLWKTGLNSTIATFQNVTVVGTF